MKPTYNFEPFYTENFLSRSVFCRKGTTFWYSWLVLERQTMLHYGRGIGYSKSES